MLLNFSVIIQLTFNMLMDKFSDWLHNQHLNLVPSKSEHLRITRLSNYSSSFYVDFYNIATVSVTKDLGIFVSNNFRS